MAKQQLSRRQQRKQSRTNNRKNKSQKRTRKNHQRRRMRGGSNNNNKEKRIIENKIPTGYDRILLIYYTSNRVTNPTITSHYIKENHSVPNDLKYEFNDNNDETNIKRVTLIENEEKFKIVDSLIKSINPESSKGSERVEKVVTEEEEEEDGKVADNS